MADPLMRQDAHRRSTSPTRHTLVRERRSEGQTDVDKRTAAHVDTGAADLTIGNRQPSQPPHACGGLEPHRALDSHTSAKTKIETAEVKAHRAGGAIQRPAIARIRCTQ